MSLITEIQGDIVQSSVSTASILRKAQMLAYQLDNQDFKNWVEWELNGYPTESKDFDEFIGNTPTYRKTRARILCNLVGPFGASAQNVPILSGDFPDEAVLFWTTDGIPSLEKLIEAEGEVIKEWWPDFMIEVVDKHVVQEGWRCIEAWKQIPKGFVVRIIEIVRNRLLKFTLELSQLYPDIENQDLMSKSHDAPQQISYLVHNHILVTQGGTMSTFDQRNQHVSGDQYNAAGNINFRSVQSMNEFIEELVKLQRELSKAIEAGQLDEEIATDAEYHLKKAVQEAKKPEPKKSSILSHLNQVKTLLMGFAGLATAASEAAKVLDRIF